MQTILCAILGLALPTVAASQSARVSATATVVEGITAGWMQGAAPGSSVAAAVASGEAGRATARGALSHSGRVARRVTVSVGPGSREDEGGAEMLRGSDLQISVDGAGFRRLGRDAVEIAPASGGDQRQSVRYRIGEARSPAHDGTTHYSVDVVYTVSLIGT